MAYSLTSIREVKLEMARALAIIAERVITPKIPSQTLRKSMQFEINRRGVNIFWPQFWAVYVDQGRAAQRRNGGFYIFFPNPDDDPRGRDRGAGGRLRPRALRPSEFDAIVEENRRRQTANPAGGPFQLAVLARSTAAVKGAFFLERSLAEIRRRGRVAITQIFGRYLKRNSPMIGLRDRKATVRL